MSEELQEPHPPALVMSLAAIFDPDAWLSEADFFTDYRDAPEVEGSHSRAIHWQGARREDARVNAVLAIDMVRAWDEAHHG